MAIELIKEFDRPSLEKPWKKMIVEKTNSLIRGANSNAPSGVKRYKVLMSQSGGAAPTIDATLENSIGTIVWTRSSGGLYYGDLTGAFPQLKTFFKGPPSYGINNSAPFPIYGFGWVNANRIFISTVDAANALLSLDDLLYFTSIEVEVYP